MSFDSQLYQHQMYGAEYTEYPVASQDTNISISAVVSASCVIVNDGQQQQDVTSHFNFPQESYLPVTQPLDQHSLDNQSYPTDDFQNFTNLPYNQVSFPDINQQDPFYQSRQCCGTDNNIITQSNQSEIGNNAVPLSDSNYRCYEADDITGYTPTQSYSTPCESSLPFEPSTVPQYERRSFNDSDHIAEYESYFPDSSTSGEFEPISCRPSSQLSQEKNFKNDLDLKFDLDVDEMISTGVTVAGFKPRGIIRKRKKSKTPCDAKDGGYWSKRVKNNDSARRSRESKKEKERNFYKRALELEYENFYLKEKISKLETKLSVFSGNHDSDQMTAAESVLEPYP